MEQYISIPKDIVDIPIIAFDKPDGNNIRCEWTKKGKVFEKFGSRKVLLGEDSWLAPAIPLIKAQEEAIVKVMRDERWEKATLFFEFHGPNSFAGQHQEGDVMVATLIDVFVYKKGYLLPNDFVKLFCGDNLLPNEFMKLFRGNTLINTPDILYRGKPNQDFIRSVKDGTLPGITSEGVVCKGLPTKRGYPPTMFKIKTNAWLEKVKAKYADDPKLLEYLI